MLSPVKVSLGRYSWQLRALTCFICSTTSIHQLESKREKDNPIYYWKQTSRASKCCTLVLLSVLLVLFPVILWQNSSVFLQRQSVLYTGLHKSPLQIARTALHAKQEDRSCPWTGGALARPHLRHCFQLCWWTNANRWRFSLVVYSQSIWFVHFIKLLSKAEMLFMAWEREAHRSKSL